MASGLRSDSPFVHGSRTLVASGTTIGGRLPVYEIPLPEPGEAKRAILESYTKEHSAEYQAQSLIDLAFKMREKISDAEEIQSITLHTSHHTHAVIGTGSNDPQKMDPAASLETLDHSAMYIFAVALQDGSWHHEKSYEPGRASRPDTVALWGKVRTLEDPEWYRRYHHPDPAKKAFGARAVIALKNGVTVEDELSVAGAHPSGARPIGREDYIRKFEALAEEVATSAERRHFTGAAQGLEGLGAGELSALGIEAAPGVLKISGSGEIFYGRM